MNPVSSVLSFTDHAFGVISKKSSPCLKSFRFSPVLSSRSCIVLHFTFRSLAHFELIFVKGIRSVSTFIFFSCGYPLLPPSLSSFPLSFADFLFWFIFASVPFPPLLGNILNPVNPQNPLHKMLKRKKTDLFFEKVLSQIIVCFFIGNQIRIERKKSYSFYIAKQLKSIRYIFTTLMVTFLLMRKLDSTLCYSFFHSSSRVHLIIEAAFFFLFFANCFYQKEY